MADPQSAGALKVALDDQDREVRIAAGAGLAKLGDAGAASMLIKAADAPPGWERIQAAKNCFVLAEKLAAAGKQDDAKKIYTYLRDSRKEVTEKYVRGALDDVSSFTFSTVRTEEALGTFPNDFARHPHNDRWLSKPSAHRSRTWAWINDVVAAGRKR